MPFWYFFTVPNLPAEISHQSNQVQLQQYLLQEGAPVDSGTPVAVVENYWAKMQLKAKGKGILEKTLFRPGTHVKIGDPIAIIGADGEELPHERNCSILEVMTIKRRKPEK